MTDSERIRAIEKLKNLSTNALAKDLGLKAAQTLYDIHKGKHGISKELAEIISAKYLDVNKLWLLTGEGEMLKTEAVDTSHPPIKQSQQNIDPTITSLLNIISEMQKEKSADREALKQELEATRQEREAARQEREHYMKLSQEMLAELKRLGKEEVESDSRPNEASDLGF